MRKTIPLAFGITLSLFLFVTAGTAKKDPNQYKQVETEDLAERPQNFWSMGITFTDTLISLPYGSTKIDKTRYAIIETEIIGECLIKASIASSLDESSLNRDHIFTGTVLSRKTFMRKKKSYSVVIKEAVKGLESDLDSLSENTFPGDDPTLTDEAAEELELFHEFLRIAQAGLVGYAQANGLELSDVLHSRNGKGRETAGIIRKAIRKVETAEGTTSTEMLVAYSHYLLSRKYPTKELPQVEEMREDAKKAGETAPNYEEEVIDYAPMQSSEQLAEQVVDNPQDLEKPPPAPTPSESPEEIMDTAPGEVEMEMKTVLPGARLEKPEMEEPPASLDRDEPSERRAKKKPRVQVPSIPDEYEQIDDLYAPVSR